MRPFPCLYRSRQAFSGGHLIALYLYPALSLDLWRLGHPERIGKLRSAPRPQQPLHAGGGGAIGDSSAEKPLWTFIHSEKFALLETFGETALQFLRSAASPREAAKRAPGRNGRFAPRREGLSDRGLHLPSR